jgi:GAF domain-containing protein
MTAPPNELEDVRLKTLHATGIIGSPRDERYDRLVYIAAQLVRAPMAVIGFVDRDRMWFKAKVGFEQQEVPREDVLCEMALADASILVAPDARAVPQLWGNKLVVGAPFVRFYACVPLRSDEGVGIGVLSVLGKQPRTISESQKLALQNIAREVENLVRERIVSKELVPKRRG